MAHGTEKQLEHAEHAQHAAHNPFDRKVAMSMAIVAAALAGVTLLSHRGHTETLRLTTVANIYHTQASDQYNFYQAKNIRSAEYQAYLMNTLMNKSKDVDPVVKANSEKIWMDQVNKYEGKAAKEGEKNEKDYWTLMEDYLKSPDKTVKRPKRFKDPAKSELSDLLQQAGDLQKQAKKLEHASHELHTHVNWIDYGHLALELGLVLASIAVLTKGRGFWFAGLGVSALGIVLAGVGLIGMLQMEKVDEHHADHPPGEQKKEGAH